MNIYRKTLIKYEQIKFCNIKKKKLFTMTFWDLFQRCKTGSILKSQSIRVIHHNRLKKKKNTIILSIDAEK